MPARSSSAKKSAAASSAKATKPTFDFKSMKRDKSAKSYASGSSGAGSARAHERESKPTATRVQKAKYQSGDKEGENSGSHLFIFNPRYGLNDKCLDAIKTLAYPKDDVSNFKKDLDGFMVKVRTPKQAQRMQDALHKLDDATPDTIDVGDMAAPTVTIVTVENLDLPATKANEEREGVTALLLEGYTYPLYKKLRELGYDFVRGVHNRDGIHRWVRVVGGKESADKLESAIEKMLSDEGWDVETATADAANWESDDEDDDE